MYISNSFIRRNHDTQSCPLDSELKVSNKSKIIINEFWTRSINLICNCSIKIKESILTILKNILVLHYSFCSVNGTNIIFQITRCQVRTTRRLQKIAKQHDWNVFSFRPPDLFHHFNFFLSPGKFTLRGRPHRRTINCPKQSLVNDVDVCTATVQLFMSR